LPLHRARGVRRSHPDNDHAGRHRRAHAALELQGEERDDRCCGERRPRDARLRAHHGGRHAEGDADPDRDGQRDPRGRRPEAPGAEQRRKSPLSHGSTRYITPEALFRLRFQEELRPTWDVAVLSFRGDGGTHALVTKLNARPLDRKVLYGFEVSRDRPVVYEAALGGRRIVLVTHCLWGGPQTAILVEELAAFGVRDVIGFGVAGSVVDILPKGTQVIATKALATDGTSRAHSGDAAGGAGAGLAAALVMTAERLGSAVTPVTIATVDALYRETPVDVKRWVGLGAQAINMETTPLYAAAAVCGVRSVWLGHISDPLSPPPATRDSWQRPGAMTHGTEAMTPGLLD